MKKSIFGAAVLSAVVIVLTTVSSCSKKKDYTCVCTDSSDSTYASTVIANSKKSDAQKACEAGNATWASYGLDISCHLQ